MSNSLSNLFFILSIASAEPSQLCDKVKTIAPVLNRGGGWAYLRVECESGTFHLHIKDLWEIFEQENPGISLSAVDSDELIQIVHRNISDPSKASEFHPYSETLTNEQVQEYYERPKNVIRYITDNPWIALVISILLAGIFLISKRYPVLICSILWFVYFLYERCIVEPGWFRLDLVLIIPVLVISCIVALISLIVRG